jgi:hypothetical protein
MHRRETHLQDELPQILHDSGVRTGVCAGVSMALVFVTWLILANRVSALDRLALERNVITVTLLAILFMVPVVRFMWHPRSLLISSLFTWSIFSLAYRGLCIGFPALSDRYSAMRVFILGAVVCMILAALSWVVTLCWRTRESHLASHHRVSHSNHHV